jgi:predicted Ser/Thr protein kinase
MDTEKTCQHCGKPIGPKAIGGLCPECMMKVGLGSAVEPEPGVAGEATSKKTKSFAPPPAAELARLFPQLEIIELLGVGGMGAVYKARQPALDRFVALKILPEHAGADPGFAERFTREARALARLSHSNIVAVYEFGQANGLHYFIMEYVDGLSLRQLEQAGKLSTRQALQIIPQICEALQFAHDEGIVHRDIKPENVLLDKKGRVKIADFGLAKILGHEPEAFRLTGAGDLMGTPHYMAPEQIEHPQTVDHRADIYSLGVVFYEMLTGELPLGKFAPPSRKVEVDVRLDEVVLHALEKEPELRYQHASDVKTDVETISHSAAATPSVKEAEPQPSPRINPTAAFLPYATQALLTIPINPTAAFLLYATQALLTIPLEWSFLTLLGHAPFGARNPFNLLQGPWAGLGVWIALTLLAVILSYMAWGTLHYACWKALPEKFRATSPGQAVGFLFIPFFNFYWVFVSCGKLADGFNALRSERADLPLRNMKALAIAKAILFVCAWTIAFIPGLNAITCLADLIVFILFYRGIVQNANLSLLTVNRGPTPVPESKKAATIPPLAA